MADEREYISILDGAEDEEAEIVILPEDDETSEADYEPVTRTSVYKEEELDPDRFKGELTVADRIKNFWYYHKITVIVVLVIVLLLGVFVKLISSYESSDVMVALNPDEQISSDATIYLSDFLSNIETENGKLMVGVDQKQISETDIDASFFADTLIEGDYNQHRRFIYITTLSKYDYITAMYSDFFTTYNGCAEWIALENTSLGQALTEAGFDCTGLGISLLAPPQEPDEETQKLYNNAVVLLDALRALYPDTFA